MAANDGEDKLLRSVALQSSQSILLTRQRAEEELIRTKEALERKTRELTDFFEDVSIGLHWLDADGIIQRVNQAELNLLGYTHEEYVGQPIARFHADPAENANLLPRLSAGEKLRDVESRMRCKDGSIKYVLLDASTLWQDGQFVHSRWIVRDITDRKRVEEAQARLAAIVESSQDAIVSKTLDSRIVSWNAGAEQLFGYTAEEMIGELITKIIPADRQHEEAMILGRVRRGERVEHFETVRRTKSGKLIDVSVTISPIHDGSGHVIGASKIARDISARRQMEEKLKESDRRKDEFLAMLAHELRNPLAPIRNAVHIFRGKGPPVPELQWATEVIDRQVHQMTRLVDDLLDVSRITRGKIELRKERVELAAVVSSAIEASRPLIEKWDHQLTVAIPPQPIYLEADSTRLTQVLLNLLNNAAKYMKQGGRIWVSAERQGDHALIRVKDTGIGIPSEMLPRIFDMFTQVDRSLERSDGGLGIGLTLVQRLVEMHGGKVEAHSEGPGKGSEFVVRLPLPAPREARRGQGDSGVRDRPLTPTEPRRILVVDDNRDAADSLGMLLRMVGHDVHTAYDGLEAVGAAATFRPELVLLDIGLPKLNGYEVARQVRNQQGGKDVVLVALTGWGQEEDRRRSLDAGFNFHMTKPLEFAALQKLLVKDLAKS